MFGKSIIDNKLLFELFCRDYADFKVRIIEKEFTSYELFEKDSVKNLKKYIDDKIFYISCIILGINNISTNMEKTNKKKLSVLIKECQTDIIKLDDLKKKWKELI